MNGFEPKLGDLYEVLTEHAGWVVTPSYSSLVPGDVVLIMSESEEVTLMGWPFPTYQCLTSHGVVMVRIPRTTEPHWRRVI